MKIIYKSTYTYKIFKLISEQVVEFIYKEYVYSIEASTISLKYEENKDLYNYIFKFAHEKLIKDLEKGLGVVHSRFWGLF